MNKSMTKTYSAGDDVQVIHGPGGVPIFAVVPWAMFESLKNAADEDAVLIAAGDAARNDFRFPEPVARRLASGENALKVIREWRQLTQQGLGANADVSPVYISQIERGSRRMGRKAAGNMAVALGLPAKVLLDLMDEED